MYYHYGSGIPTCPLFRGCPLSTIRGSTFPFLCCAGAIAVLRSYVTTVWPIHIMDINCTGLEESIWDCPFNNGRVCTRMQDASVQCQGEAISIIIARGLI